MYKRYRSTEAGGSMQVNTNKFDIVKLLVDSPTGELVLTATEVDELTVQLSKWLDENYFHEMGGK